MKHTTATSNTAEPTPTDKAGYKFFRQAHWIWRKQKYELGGWSIGKHDLFEQFDFEPARNIHGHDQWYFDYSKSEKNYDECRDLCRAALGKLSLFHDIDRIEWKHTLIIVDWTKKLSDGKTFGPLEVEGQTKDGRVNVKGEQ